MIYGVLAGRLQVSTHHGAGGPGGTGVVQLSILEADRTSIELSIEEAYTLSLVLQCINLAMSPAGVGTMLAMGPHAKLWKASDWPA